MIKKILKKTKKDREKEKETAEEFLNLIKSRRSIRSFSETPVEWDKIVNILNAGRWAPSAGNLQDWKFIVVNENEKKEEIATACLEQEWIGTADTIIVVCNQPEKNKSFYYEKGEKIYSIQDGATAVENMLLMAQKEKLGACWVGAYDDEELKRVLDIPAEVQISAVIPIGYPGEKVPTPPRKTLEKIAYFNTYGNKIKDMDKYLKNFGTKNRKLMEKSIKKLNKKIIPKNK